MTVAVNGTPAVTVAGGSPVNTNCDTPAATTTMFALFPAVKETSLSSIVYDPDSVSVRPENVTMPLDIVPVSVPPNGA